jgi:hypothetical protein
MAGLGDADTAGDEATAGGGSEADEEDDGPAMPAKVCRSDGDMVGAETGMGGADEAVCVEAARGGGGGGAGG